MGKLTALLAKTLSKPGRHGDGGPYPNVAPSGRKSWVQRIVIDGRRPTWSNPKPAAQWQSTLQTYAFPLVGRKAVDAITAADVMEALTPIWASKPDTASRVHQRMETVMDWTVAQSCRLDNPAGRSLLKALEGELRLSRTATG